MYATIVLMIKNVFFGVIHLCLLAMEHHDKLAKNMQTRNVDRRIKVIRVNSAQFVCFTNIEINRYTENL